MGELMSGQRGLVPSNFVEKVAGNVLTTPPPPPPPLHMNRTPSPIPLTLHLNESQVTAILCLPRSLYQRGTIEYFNITSNDGAIGNPRTIWHGRGEGGDLNNTKSKVKIHLNTYSVKQFSTSSTFQEQVLFLSFSSLSIKSNNVDILKHSMNTNL